MSTRGVRRRLIDAILQRRGLVTLEDLQAVVAYAMSGPLTDGEKRIIAGLGRTAYLSRRLRRDGLGPTKLRIEGEALAYLEQLTRQWGLPLDLHTVAVLDGEGEGDGPSEPAGPDTPQQPQDDPQDDPAAELEQARSALDQALEAGRDLGDFTEWQVRTPGADVRFHVEVFGQGFPALVMDKPVVEDPGIRDLVEDHAAELAEVEDLDGLEQVARRIVEEEAAYLAAEDLQQDSRNRRYAVQNQRRSQLLVGLRDLAMGRAGLGLAVNSRLIALRDDIVSGQTYDMEVGSHTNYWPYWDNYVGVIEKLLGQLEPGSPGARAVENRVADIHRRKTVFGYSRQVDEKDVEQSLGGILVAREHFSSGPAHRVSLAEGSTPYEPRYERLSLADQGLPEAHEALAGAPLYRDQDGTIRFDRAPGLDVTVGAPLPQDLSDRVQAHGVDVAQLGLRRPLEGEALRPGISWDWNRSRDITVAPIQIGWWGHCHNEAPANAMGLDPRKGVSLYRADRAVAAEAALVELSEEDCWDLVGAFTSDHEGERVRDPRTGAVSQPGYVLFSTGQGYHPTRVDRTSFVGNRNNGGHWFQLMPGFEGARRIRIEAEVTDIWGLEDPSVHYDPPLSRFRRDIELEDGSFEPNPDWVESGMTDDDMIAVTAAGRRMSMTTRYITFDATGSRVERHEEVDLDPEVDDFVHLADEIEYPERGGGGRLVEHWFNPCTREYRSVEIHVRPADGFERVETGRDTWPASEIVAVQETTYDSVAEIDEYVVADMGLPLTFDTSSGQAVWNYPVDSIRRDVLGRVEKVEEGEPFVYTTYRMRYTTMGGPQGDARYIMKRDAMGRMVRAMALDPMPDFAFRNEHWVCAPVAMDIRGEAALNLRALTEGYGTDVERKSIVATLWERQAIALYASLSEETARHRAFIFEEGDGRLLSFPDRASFEAAVEADQALRQLERGTTTAG